MSLTLDIEKEFGNKIEEIWNDEKYKNHDDIKELINRGYWLEKEIIKDSILFIGINPSFNGKVIGKGDNYYKNEQRNNPYPRYNQRFEKISESVGHPWSHHDTLFFRNTEQKFIKKVLWDSDEGCDFLDRQAVISAKIIHLAEPKVIVVTNTLAREYIKKFLPKYTFPKKWVLTALMISVQT